MRPALLTQVTWAKKQKNAKRVQTPEKRFLVTFWKFRFLPCRVPYRVSLMRIYMYNELSGALLLRHTGPPSSEFCFDKTSSHLRALRRMGAFFRNA